MPPVPRLLIAALTLLLAGCTAVEPGSPRAASPSDSETAGGEALLSDRDLQERWWAWAASSPEERNPVVDPTGQFCNEDQPADVWFFAGTFGGNADRSCQVPAGRPLAGPAINKVGSVSDCRSFMAAATGAVTLDGQPVAVRKAEPARITFQVARDSPMGARPGRVSGQACGLWVWIPPLAPGEHELRIEGESDGFRTSARYRLTVGASD